MTMARNPSVPSGGVVRKQGPEWLVDLLFAPPGWVRTVFAALVVVALALVVRGLAHRRWRLDVDDQRKMLDNAVMMISILAVALVFVSVLDQPYWVDVLGGWAGGIALCRVALRVGRSDRVREQLDQWGFRPEERVGLVWLVVGIAALGLPELDVGRGTVPLVSRGSLLLFVVSVGLVFYNIVISSAVVD